jgi:hypothetical protein
MVGIPAELERSLIQERIKAGREKELSLRFSSQGWDGGQ